MLSKTLRTSAMVIGAASLLLTSPTIVNKPSSRAISNAAAATEPVSSETKTMVVTLVAKKDDRAELLSAFLVRQNSPMAADAVALVAIADKYSLDWTFLPAIAGLESQYGKMVPAGSFNPYGWNNGKTSFRSWADASETVAAGIRSRYQASGEVTPWAIGSRYAASPTWAVRVARNQEIIGRFVTLP